MKFRTEVSVPKVSKQLDYSSSIALFGSCFSNSISKKLTYHKFTVFTNSHGIVFNPKAIEQSIADCIQKRIYTENDLVQHAEMWHSMQHHSSFSGLAKEDVLEKINTQIIQANEFLKKASHLVITLGTAWVYHYIERDELVANCHKIPQQNFIKRLLTVAEIKEALATSIALLKQLNPDCTVLFTLSPVRHTKDGMIENAQSKAQLLTAIHQVVDSKTSFYFPSYEIMLDDLRDYRFYKADMIHPNEVAVAYIWDKFKNTWISNEALTIAKKVASLQTDLQHKPFNTKNKNYQKFLASIEQKKQALVEFGFNEYIW